MANGDERPSGLRAGGDLLGGLASLVKALGELGQTSTSNGPTEFTLPGGAQGVYGFSVRTGLGRQAPAVNQFGNMKVTNEGAVVSDTREPLIDVFDEGAEVLLVAELPGVKEVDVAVDVRGDIVAISANGPRQKYVSETLLPSEVEADPVSRSCENGYLQLRFAKVVDTAAAGASPEAELAGSEPAGKADTELAGKADAGG